MDLGNRTNLEIIKKFCLVDGGCPKLSKCKDYTERVKVCSQCIDKVYKYDMVEILRELYATPTSSPLPPGKGKSTELSKAQIEKILTLYHSEKWSINRIAKDLHLQHLTVKNVIYGTFKSEYANEKVQNIKNEMGL